MPRRQAPSPLPRGVTKTLSARVGLLAHEFRRSDLQRAPSTFLNASVERLQSEGSLLTYSGGTAPVSHRTSLLCPHGHPSDASLIEWPTYRRRTILVKQKLSDQVSTTLACRHVILHTGAATSHSRRAGERKSDESGKRCPNRPAASPQAKNIRTESDEADVNRHLSGTTQKTMRAHSSRLGRTRYGP